MSEPESWDDWYGRVVHAHAEEVAQQRLMARHSECVIGQRSDGSLIAVPLEAA